MEIFHQKIFLIIDAPPKRHELLINYPKRAHVQNKLKIMEWKYSRQPERVLSSRRGLGALPRQDRLCWRWEYFIEFAGKYFTEENISDSGRGQAGGLQLFIFLYLAGQQRHHSRLRDWQLVAHISSLMLGFGCLEQFHSNICVSVNYKRAGVAMSDCFLVLFSEEIIWR